MNLRFELQVSSYKIMIWVDREAKKIIERKLPVEWVDDMKTPSGRIHVGSLRGMLVHDLMYKVLKEKNLNVHFSYVFNDMDQMDSIPSYLDQKKWSAYSGKPLNKIPSPEPGYESFADYYAQEFIQVFNSINCHPEIIWSHELYESGKMNDVIKLFLDNADKVREIYKRIAKADRAKDWYPFNPICEKCGNIGTTNVTKWDGEFVYYTCEPKIVDWATGCGHVGKISPYNGNGKLPWKLDWPAHWKTIGVTIEGAGKDHMSSGGSYDMAATFCKEILHYEAPYPLAYEWFTIGGKKMSSSKGIGTSAKEVSSILPPEVFRFLIVRTPIGTHLDFHPYGVTIPNLFDDYDQCMNAYFMKIENSLPQGKQGEVLEDYARIVELSAVRFMPKNKLFLPRFRTIANMLNQKPDFTAFFERLKKSPLNIEEKLILEERIKFAKIYVDNYAEDLQDKNIMPVKFNINETQRKFLQLLIEKLKLLQSNDSEKIQTLIFTILKENGFKPKEVFQGFYQALTGKDFGPKAHDIIIQTGIGIVIEKLNAYIHSQNSTKQNTVNNIFPDLKDISLFTIDPEVKKMYPS
ncbi:MAG: lysine--tRNA ligase, partial [bacterium]|nr:lysine--tRNA ligase [bacterium]